MLEKNGEERKNEFEVNIVPVIDCFTVLITFLLVSVSFLSFGVFQVQPMIFFAQNTVPVMVENHVSVVMKDNTFDLMIKIHGKMNKEILISGLSNTWDIQKLSVTLQQTKEMLPDLKAIGIYPTDSTDYENIIVLLDAIKKVTPNILMEGFDV